MCFLYIVVVVVVVSLKNSFIDFFLVYQNQTHMLITTPAVQLPVWGRALSCICMSVYMSVRSLMKMA